MVTRRWILASVLAAVVGFIAGVISYDSRQPAQSETSKEAKLVSKAADLAAGSRTDKTSTESQVLGLLFQSHSFRDLAELGAVLSKLDNARIGELLDRLDRPGVENRTALMHRLMAYWTKRDPDAATAWMKPRLAQLLWDNLRFGYSWGFVSDDPDGTLVRAWAQNAPDLALEFARQHPGSSMAGVILMNLIDGPLAQNDAESWQLLSTFPDKKQRERGMEVFFNKFRSRAESDYGATERAALALPPGAARNRAMEEVLAQWTGDDPAAALTKFRALGVEFPALLPLVAHRAAQQNPERVAQWLESLATSDVERCGGILVADWAKRDPRNAFAWAQKHGISLTETARIHAESDNPEPWWKEYPVSGKTPMQTAMSDNPEATMEWLRSLDPGPERARLIELAFMDAREGLDIGMLASELPGDAMGRIAVNVGMFRNEAKDLEKWADEWPAGQGRDAAWMVVGARKPDAASLPAGPDRDAMFSGAMKRFQSSPERALEYLQRIDDPNRRRQAFDDMICGLRPSVDVEFERIRLYQQWMENPGIPEEWKKPWRMYNTP